MSIEDESLNQSEVSISVPRAVRNLSHLRRSPRSIGHLASVAQKIARSAARSLSDRVDGTQDLPVRLDSRLRAVAEYSDSKASTFSDRDILALRRSWQPKSSAVPVAPPSLPLALNYRGRGPSGDQTAPSAIARNLERTVVAVPPNPATNPTLSAVRQSGARQRSSRSNRRTSRASAPRGEPSRGGTSANLTEGPTADSGRNELGGIETGNIPGSSPRSILQPFKRSSRWSSAYRYGRGLLGGVLPGVSVARVLSRDVPAAPGPSAAGVGVASGSGAGAAVGGAVVGRGLLGGVLPGVSVARVVSRDVPGPGVPDRGPSVEGQNMSVSENASAANAGYSNAFRRVNHFAASSGYRKIPLATADSRRIDRKATFNVKDLAVSLGSAVPIASGSSREDLTQDGSLTADAAARMVEEGNEVAQIRRVTSGTRPTSSVGEHASESAGLTGLGRLPYQMGPFNPEKESSEGLSTTEILNFAEWVNRVVKEQLRTELERFGWEGYRR